MNLELRGPVGGGETAREKPSAALQLAAPGGGLVPHTTQPMRERIRARAAAALVLVTLACCASTTEFESPKAFAGDLFDDEVDIVSYGDDDDMNSLAQPLLHLSWQL